VVCKQTNVKRAELVCEKSWGLLEEKGVCFLDPIPTNFAKNSLIWDHEFKVVVPFFLLVHYYDQTMRAPQEPLFSYDNKLTADNNEIQDLSTILWRLSCHPKSSTVDLSEIIPVVPREKFTIIVPHNLKTQGSSSRISGWDVISSMTTNKKLSHQAIINGRNASFADSFLLLQIAGNKKEWLVILIQSKRKESFQNRQKKDGELAADLSKVLGKWNQNQHPNYIFLYITDAKEVTPVQHSYENVFVISAKEHEKFYGTLRSQLKTMRNSFKGSDSKSIIPLQLSQFDWNNVF